MIPTHLRNPFLISKLEETFQIPPGDVPELHAGTLAACEQVVRQIKGATPQHDTSFGLLVVGEAGSGKSHLLAQLRRRLQGSEDVVLVAIAMRGAFAGRLWRHLRENLVTELLRDFSSGQTTTNGLARLLRNRFPQLASSTPQSNPSKGVIALLFSDPQSPQKLSTYLQKLAANEDLDNGLIRVLPALDRPELRMLARDWLLGRQLTDEEQQRLNLPVSHPSEIEQEVQSRNLVRSLLRLAGRETRLVLCFDEVEAIQAGSYDDTVLRQFTTLVTDVLALPGPRAVITCVRTHLQLQMQKVIEKSNLQKLAQRQSNIPTLTWEQSVQIVLARLQADPQIAELRQRQATYWPFGEEYLRRIWEKFRHGLTPRHLINLCAEEFNRLQAQPGEDGRKSRDSVFARIWERNRHRFLERPASLQFDAMLGLVIPWLVNVHQLPLQRRSGHSDLLGDINLLFAFRERRVLPLGISFCNQEPSYFWRRLDRLIKQWESQRGRLLGKLLLLRANHMRITPGALQRLERLQELGAEVLFLETQQLAELAAFQTMMTAALEGDLTHEGSPVDSHDYDTWVRSNTSDAVKEFLDALFPELHPAEQTAEPMLSPVEVGK